MEIAGVVVGIIAIVVAVVAAYFDYIPVRGKLRPVRKDPATVQADVPNRPYDASSPTPGGLRARRTDRPAHARSRPPGLPGRVDLTDERTHDANLDTLADAVRRA
ncbi:hypothetical protein KZ829_40850 [Actinoplanes hulinensis]|uniref:Secreted protein n=1 Tax=Actinoplanes hulinensis TaxID=1144547 RepID=A0ABS7BH06_9ACTN|nr:hypothetical protein [Actinoplanes hulinensis]MBW6440092.1 hypothetical protein [Actinoplanes hulinensis]